jgi:hypothetical protein
LKNWVALGVNKRQSQSQSAHVGQKGLEQSPALPSVSEVLISGFVFLFKGHGSELALVFPEEDKLGDWPGYQNYQESVRQI